ncbi:hypothetical protein QEN19_001097 [Hanseniaspora menglaensis]
MTMYNKEGILIGLKDIKQHGDMVNLASTVHYLKYYKYDCVGKIFIENFPDTKEYSWSRLREYFEDKNPGPALKNPKNAFQYFATKFDIAHRSYLTYLKNGVPRNEWPIFVKDWEEIIKRSLKRKTLLFEFLAVAKTNKSGDSFNNINLLIIMPSNVNILDSYKVRLNRFVSSLTKQHAFETIQTLFLYNSNSDIDIKHLLSELLLQLNYKKINTLDDLMTMFKKIHQAYLYFKCFFPNDQLKWPLYAREWNHLLFPNEPFDSTSDEEITTEPIALNIKLVDNNQKFKKNEETHVKKELLETATSFENDKFYVEPLESLHKLVKKKSSNKNKEYVNNQRQYKKIHNSLKKINRDVISFETYYSGEISRLQALVNKTNEEIANM